MTSERAVRAYPSEGGDVIVLSDGDGRDAAQASGRWLKSDAVANLGDWR